MTSRSTPRSELSEGIADDQGPLSGQRPNLGLHVALEQHAERGEDEHATPDSSVDYSALAGADPFEFGTLRQVKLDPVNNDDSRTT